MPTNNIILTNPTIAFTSQFIGPFNIITTQENKITNNLLGFQNPTEYAASQFNANWSTAITQQEAQISNPTIPYTPTMLPANAGNTVGPGGVNQPAAGIALPNVMRSNPTILPNGGSAINPNQSYDIATTQENNIASKPGFQNPTFDSTGGSIIDITQPYDIQTNSEQGLSAKNLSLTSSGTNDWFNTYTLPDVIDTYIGQNTNITPKSGIIQAIGFGSTIGGSILGVPQITQIGNSFLNQLDGLNTAPYLSLPKNRLKPMPGVKYSDFRSRFSFPGNSLEEQKNADDDTKDSGFLNTINQTQAYLSSRRLDGLGAQLRGSFKAGAYAAASATPIGAYSIFNLDGFGPTGYGWGDHDNSYVLRNDFTSRSHVATIFKVTPKQKRTSKKRGTKTRKGGSFIQSSNPLEKITPFRGDKVNVVDFGERTLREAYLWKPVKFDFDKKDKFHGLKLTQDFIKFYFTGPSLVNGKSNSDLEDDIIVFRAIITNLGDSFTAQWNPVNMIGRADPNYHYTGFSRDLSLSFDVYATDRDELKPIYRKLNALAGYTAPTYDPNSIAMEAPWMRITIGDLFVQQPVVLTSLSFTYATDASWEINIENDPDMMQVPLKIGVQCSFNLVTDYLPRKGGNFFTLSKEFDDNGLPKQSKYGNWLSDFDSQPLDELPRIENTIYKGKEESKSKE